MGEQFSGEVSRLHAGPIDGFRSIEAGFRFVIELPPSFTMEGPDWLGARDRAPGEYVVRYDGAFHLVPLTPPALQVDLRWNPAFDEPPTAYLPASLGVAVGNEGLEDAHDVLVTVSAAQREQIAWSDAQTVTVLSGEVVPVAFEWAPTAPGPWTVRAEARLAGGGEAEAGAAGAESTIRLPVQPARGTGLRQEVTAFGVVAPWPVALLLLSLGLAGAVAGWAVLRSVQREAGASAAGGRQGGER